MDHLDTVRRELLLLQPVHLSYSSLPWPVGVCREADC